MITQKHTLLSVIALLLLAVGPLAAAPIPVIGVKKQVDGVLLTMNPGRLRIQVDTASIIHVVYGPAETLPVHKSFVVVKAWTPVPFTLKSDAATVTVATGKVRVIVNSATGSVHFQDAAGHAILDEAAGGGKTMVPTEVNGEQSYIPRQTFASPKDECLYGMGQYQDGLWNWRGVPLELRQANTTIALPMLVSTKGYGLLWDNASLTEFNPADQQIALSSPNAASSTNPNPTSTQDLPGQSHDAPKVPDGKTGTFKSGAAGDYVFFVRDGNRFGNIALLLDGKPIAGVQNMWTPYALSAKVKLPANTTCTLEITGGGLNTKLFGRPIGNTTTFRSTVGDTIDYTFFYGPELDQVIAGYRLATGEAPMWPKWAYGFWQCRERYASQQETLDAAAQFRSRHIPIDLIVQDWQYWGNHGWGAYEWDNTAYPDPAAMISQLHAENVKYMISVWSDPSGIVEKALKDVNAEIPGTSWSDMYNPAARAIRWKFMDKAFFSIGTDAWWQDATEPSDDGNVVNNTQVYLGSANRVRNAYPLFASEATYEGQRKTTSAKRVVILTRSAYPGAQRYSAAAWSGDVNGTWDSFRRQIPAGLNFCITGIPYWTTDTGGFFRPGSGQYQSPEYNELLTRWFEWSTFCPILRIHGYQTQTELWNYPLAEQNLLKYDNLRYRMLPYNYSVAWKVTSAGYTIMRALPMDFRSDPNAAAISDEYMFGPAFLVAPVTQAQAATRRVYLPQGTSWIDFWTGKTLGGGKSTVASAPIGTLPLFVRAGSIVPLGPDVQYTSEKPADPIELRVYPGADGDFTLYEDEGDNYNYEHGAYATIPIHWDNRRKSLTIGARKGSFPGILAQRTFNIILVKPGHGLGGDATASPNQVVRYHGRQVQLQILH